jgi:hypothetical protein
MRARARGINTRSATAIEAVIMSVNAGGVSITTSCTSRRSRVRRWSGRRAISTAAKSGVGASRLFHQAARLPWESVAVVDTGPAPARSAATARCAARVVLPAPPF